MHKWLPALMVLLGVFLATHFFGPDESTPPSAPPDARLERASGADSAIERAYRARTSNVPVTGSGVVTRILPDDNDGDRHQRFIVALESGLTLLIAHNVDLAPRIPAIGIGDRVRFLGEYEWNDQGGVIHWTHHDPDGRHVGGWLEHDGKRYE